MHARIGYHIAFTHVSPALRWYGPELYFEQLELRSKDDQRVLARAAGGRIGADIWQLLRHGTLYAGRIELDAPNIVIARLAADKFALASEIQLGGGDGSLAAKQLDDLPAGTLSIRQGLITIENWNPQLPRLQLRDVELKLLRDDATVALRMAASLPAVLGGSVDINAAAHGSGRVDGLPWTALIRARALSFPGWHALLPEELARLGSGSGGFEMAARGQGASLRRADLDFEANAVTTQLTDEPGVTFDQVSAALTVTHAGDRWTLLGRRVRAQRQGRRDPDSEVRGELARCRRIAVARGDGQLSAHGNAAAARRAAATKGSAGAAAGDRAHR